MRGLSVTEMDTDFSVALLKLLVSSPVNPPTMAFTVSTTSINGLADATRNDSV